MLPRVRFKLENGSSSSATCDVCNTSCCQLEQYDKGTNYKRKYYFKGCSLRFSKYLALILFVCKDDF